jgi:hypothetical protein
VIVIYEDIRMIVLFLISMYLDADVTCYLLAMVVWQWMMSSALPILDGTLLAVRSHSFLFLMLLM